MSDQRTQKAWRDWVNESTPERAQVYCTEVARSGLVPCGATKLPDVSLDSTYREGLQDLVSTACRRFLATDFEDTMVEELYWLTENHYWVIGQPSPSILRALGKLYEDHGMELKEGDEEEAQNDLDTMAPRRSQESNSELREEVRTLRAKVNGLELQLKNADRAASHRKTAEARLRSQVDRLQKYEADAHKHAGMEAINATLKRENERLTKLLQDKAK